MKIMKPLRRLGLLAVLVSTAAFCTLSASADLLTNTWFKLILTAHGHTLGTNDITVRPLQLTRTVYAQFPAEATPSGSQTYQVKFWTKGDTGWSNSATSTKSVIGLKENFISDWFLTFRGANSNSFTSFHTAFINTKTNSAGRLRSATYSGRGEITGGNINGKRYFGGFRLLGTTVRPARLPFDP